MIGKREILAIAQQASLTPHVVEKDYVLGWMLAGIYGHEDLAKSWIFKGGTCLKKCFFETYRFSEDLDFTLRKPEHLGANFLQGAFSEIGEWIYDQTGIEIPADKQEFDIYQNPRGQVSCQGKISYKGPVSSTHALPRIKLDLTADERVVLPPVRTQIFHPYSDSLEDGIEVLAYDYIEAFAEKFRALAERTRPRDLYDVVHLYWNAEARPDPERFMEVLRAKCEFKGISIPSMADLDSHRAELEAGWIHMLEHQLPALLPVTTFWDALPDIFNWLRGAVTQPLAAMPVGAGDTLIRERVVDLPAGSRGQSFVEMIRFAAANRLLVEIDYRDKQGNRSTRAIEAYSLRRSQAGDVLLMAVRADSGQPRSYLVDSILGVKPTQTPFTPRYLIELIGIVASMSAARIDKVALAPETRELVLLQDRDAAGERAWAALNARYADSPVSVSRVLPTEGKDLNEALLALGPEALREQLAAFVPLTPAEQALHAAFQFRDDLNAFVERAGQLDVHPFYLEGYAQLAERVSPLYQLDHQSDEVRRYLTEFDQWGRGQRAGRERVVSHLEALDAHQRDFEALERAAKRAGHGVGGSAGLQDWINRRKDLAKTGEQLLAEPRYAPHLDNLAGARQRIEKVVALVRERAESLSNEPRRSPGISPV